MLTGFVKFRYDLAGVAGDRTMRMIQQDWSHLLHKKKVLDSPNYLHHNGKPVIAIWGKLATILSRYGII